MPGGRPLRRLLRRRDPLVPPAGTGRQPPRRFIADGDELLLALVTLAGLRPDHRVLDVGSAYGRVARPLAGFLEPPGSYLGIDADPAAVAWCAEQYAGRTGIAFVHLDVLNARYRPDAGAPASEAVFPAADGEADTVVMASVLGHLVTAEAERYLAEARRVLRPGGRLLAGVHLLDLASRAAIGQQRAMLPFRLDAMAGPMAVVDPELPEEAVAFDHEWLEETAAALGLARVEAAPGRWRGGHAHTDRDLLVLESRR